MSGLPLTASANVGVTTNSLALSALDAQWGALAAQGSATFASAGVTADLDVNGAIDGLAPGTRGRLVADVGLTPQRIMVNAQIMDARSVGANESNIVLGKHSGRHALKTRLQALGYELSNEDISRVFLRFKDLADKKKQITDADLETLVMDMVQPATEIYRLPTGAGTGTAELKSPRRT